MSAADIKTGAVHIRLTDQGSLERAEKLLAGIPGGLDKAVRSAEARAVSYLKTNSARAIRERYDIPVAAIKAAEDVSVYTYSFRGGISARISFHGNKISLYKYGGSRSGPSPTTRVPLNLSGGWRMVLPGPSAFGHQLKATAPMEFRNAFVATMKHENGRDHDGFFYRTGDKTSDGHDKIKELMGSAVAQMLDSEEVKEPLTAAAADKFQERLDHEINAILNGWRESR